MHNVTSRSLALLRRLLGDAVVNFQTSQEEVTLCVSPEKVLLKNYVDDEPGECVSGLTSFMISSCHQ